ncbi:FMN-dependent dehydrogenase-domain-containing protein [Annulohypoxylon truncatum]|uniref:FMN-dependent dehydrogenase-domain-containing protein n=1 Tax=Annulohypoxylon truncatum TaxID=327061 RepID=UPI002007D1B9|nr:FMN-dependent dehydrogenase-domain-containing protein [Annulohypoxylon truncatum]KAI1214589.1 FMN-dependent dehydrogenase-domain-containing protein [Annulohypoxylon truncatum]
MGDREAEKLVSVDEISQHRSLDDLWLVVDNVVYDLSAFAEEHPGGVSVLLQHAGRDATTAYSEVHSPSLIKTSLPASSRIGMLDKATVTEEWAKPPPQAKGPPAQKTPDAKPPLESIVNARDFEVAAEASFTAKAWAFASSAATDCLTKDRNGSVYDEIMLRPRVLRDVADVDLSTTMLGHRIKAPVFCAPTSMGRIFHPEGEREIGRGCQRVGVPQCVSTSCSFPLPEVMDAVEEEGQIMAKEGDGEAGVVPVFFQLYVDKNRSKSEALLKMVRERGVKAIFLTIDAPVIGKREADERVKSDESIRAPMSGAQAKNDKKGGALGRLMGNYIDASLTWDDVAWLRKHAPGLPIVLKGIQTSMDAVKAMEVGVEAIYITNHGGRSLDTVPATILVLLELQKCCPQVFERMEVFIDGGITRGTDIFKALCLGAKAVGIGRGFLYSLNYGKEGIEHFVDSEYIPMSYDMRWQDEKKVGMLTDIPPKYLRTS